MKKRLGIFLMCFSVLLSGLQIVQTQVYAGTQYKGTHFATGFETYEPDTMEMSSWSNGGMFNCTWHPDNISFDDGIMSLKIDSDGKGGYTGAEYRTQQAFGYGMYSVNMKAIQNPGVVTSFFTYTGPSDGTVWDEIDIEFLGYDTTKVQFNYFTNGVGNHEYLYDLGFDASKEFHTYGFYWAEDSITWYVDEKPVYTATVNIPSTPGKIMMNVWPGIGVDSWLRSYDGTTPLTAYYDWMAYDAPLTGPGDETDTDIKESTGTDPEESSDIIVEPGEQIVFNDNQVYTILSKNSGKALDVSYGQADNGTNVLQYTYYGYDNQKWYIQKLDNGYYIIKSYATGKVLSVENFSTENGGNVHQWEYVGNENQEWSVLYTDGYYKIINRYSGLLLDVSDISKEDNANVQQWEDVNQDNQLWKIAVPGESGGTTESEETDRIVEPSIVTGVNAVYDADSNQVIITWDDNGAVMYKVVRTDGRNSYVNLTYSATAAGWTDSKDLVDAQLYYYRVIGYFKDKEGKLVMGEMSDAAGVVATDSLPEKVVNVQAAVSGNKVTLTWDKADGARYYKLSRAAGTTGQYYCIKYNIEDTVYTDTAVTAGLYRYKVVGYYKDVDGSWVYGDLCDTLYVTVK